MKSYFKRDDQLLDMVSELLPYGNLVQWVEKES